MSLKERLLGGLSPFAHLNGPVVKTAAQVAAEANQLPPAPPAPPKVGKKGGETEKSDGSDDDDEGDDESDDEDMRAADDAEGDDEMEKTKKSKKRAVRAARLRERARCAAIFLSPSAGGNPALAAQLAFASNNSRTAAIGILQAAAAGGKGGGLHGRMASVPQPAIDPGGLAAEGGRFGDRALAARDKARGKS